MRTTSSSNPHTPVVSKSLLALVFLQTVAGAALGVPVLITAPKTVNGGDTMITPTAGGSPVALSDAEISVQSTTLTMNGKHTIKSMTLTNSSLRHALGTVVPDVYGLQLTVLDSVDIPQGSAINLVGVGWDAGRGPSPGGNGSIACGPTGGGHGGAGGSNNCGTGGGTANDSASEPYLFGCAGGYYTNGGGFGGFGGGRIRLIVGGTVSLDGIIDASGENGYEYGGGAGGSIWIKAGAITGSGIIRANGGAATGPSQKNGAGGGGRISLDACGLSPDITISVAGGSGPGNQAGGTGSIVSSINSSPATPPPANAISYPTGGAAFSVSATGTAPITLRWQIESAPKGSNVWTDLSDGTVMFNGVPVGTGAGVTTNTFSFQNNPANRVSFRLRCAMTNVCGTYPSGPATYSVCTSDFTCDGGVDDSDFSIFVLGYNILDCADPAMPVNCPADVNGDGVVDDADFSIFVVAYNALLCD